MFFAALGAEDAVHEIGSAAGGFVVVPHLHLAQQADGEHVQSGQQQNGGKDHERAVLGHDIGVIEELVDHQPAGDAASAEKMLSMPTVPKKCSGRER